MPYEKVMFTTDKDDWTTPQDLFDSLNEEFHFTVDLCASKENHLCDKYYSIENDGMKANLTGERVFCNPPYGRKSTKDWVRKCSSCGADIAVMLIPTRTDTAFFHDYILGKAEIRFLRGRLHFGGADRAPFPSMIVIFRKEQSDEIRKST